jgi:large subunit ribosomal protein L5
MKAVLKQKYEASIIKALMTELSCTSVMEIPRIVKVVINFGLGDAAQNAKLLEAGVNELATITGQKPVITRAKKSIAGFKIRQGMPVGAMVTLRGDRMYDFITKLTVFVLPRIRDFKGLNEKGFDGRGNLNIGLKDQLVFPEISYDSVIRVRGMNISIITSVAADLHAKALLVHLGFPFRKLEAMKSSINLELAS